MLHASARRKLWLLSTGYRHLSSDCLIATYTYSCCLFWILAKFGLFTNWGKCHLSLKIGPPVKTKWRRWITDNIFVQIVSKSRRRGGLYILLENHRNIGAVNYGFELFHWLPWPWPAFPDSAIFSVLCAVFLSSFFQPLRFHHGHLPPQVFFSKMHCNTQSPHSASNFRHFWGF